MPDIIHLLPDSVANQIAAGEVIQRPASVVKELVENALDAHATHVQVVIEDAGKSLVQVIDNGQGMSTTDARLAFERHATSKIRQATDLFSLRTMGFRGEALPSIAAVAQVELRTRTADEEIGVCLNIEGSKVINQVPVACPTGANFAVRNLFFNIPARRKFLKSNQTELANIMAEVERIALAHPDIAFTIRSAANTMLDLPAGNFRQRILNIFGRRLDTQLIPIATDTSLVQIHGFIGLPSTAKKKNVHQFFFCNGRFMRHPYFAKAIQMAYERLIPDGVQPPFFIHIDVDPARIDVNIHPTKTEIKFEDDAAIFQILLAAVRESLGKFGAVPTIDFDTANCPDIPAFPQQGAGNAAEVAPPQVHVNPYFTPFATTKSDIPSANTGLRTHGESHTLDPYATPSDFAPAPHLYDTLTSKEQADWQITGSGNFLQTQGRYIITPISDGLALIDQHRAHTRILYESYMRQLAAHQAPSQRLLFPEMLTVSPSEQVMLERILPQLHEVGFELSPLGGGSYSVIATPTGIDGLSPQNLISSILADAISGEADAAGTINHIIALTLARRIAIPVGQVLSVEEMSELIAQLFSCQTPNLTPDGSPTLVIITPEKYF